MFTYFLHTGWVGKNQVTKKIAIPLLTPNSHTMIKRLSSNNFEGQKILHWKGSFVLMWLGKALTPSTILSSSWLITKQSFVVSSDALAVKAKQFENPRKYLTKARECSSTRKTNCNATSNLQQISAMHLHNNPSNFHTLLRSTVPHLEFIFRDDFTLPIIHFFGY